MSQKKENQKKDIAKNNNSVMVLSVLENEDLYGYQMIGVIEKLSSGLFKFNEGTLYPILHSLENDGYVTSYWKVEGEVRPKKYYHITDIGIRLLIESKAEWKQYREAVNAVLSLA